MKIFANENLVRKQVKKLFLMLHPAWRFLARSAFS